MKARGTSAHLSDCAEAMVVLPMAVMVLVLALTDAPKPENPRTDLPASRTNLTSTNTEAMSR